MLEPRESDVPALFLFLVVLPLVAYFLLGRWSEASKKKEKISLLAQCVDEEASTTEIATLVSLAPLSKVSLHECARCYAPATTRCSRCKSIRYCSGKCQIMHWRQVHKHECHQLEQNSCSSSPNYVLNEKSADGMILVDNNIDTQCFEYKTSQTRQDNFPDHYAIYPPGSTISSEAAACMEMDTSEPQLTERRYINKQVSSKSNRDISGREDGGISESSEDACRRKAASSISSSSNLPKQLRYEANQHNSLLSEEEIYGQNRVNIPCGFSNLHTTSRSRMQESIFESRNNSGFSNLEEQAKVVTSVCVSEPDLVNEGSPISAGAGSTSSDNNILFNRSSVEASAKKSSKVKSASHLPGMKMNRSPKSAVKPLNEQSCSDRERKGQSADEPNVGRLKDAIPAQGGDGVSGSGLGKIIGLMKSTKLHATDITHDNKKKVKMLFPYEEFVKFFQCDYYTLSPRGFLNCGNSCYANAVLQCLISTKPLTIFFLRRSHSRECCAKEWCLMCELEQHITMFTESGGPLSPSRILSHMSINCQIGDGSQEDAHEFLRFLVTSMQSICLEGLGGENMIDVRLQETTFIQHTFGGRLRSKVKCLRCHQESERYETFMDLTLEIFGSVESLEDALTQFTSAEDLDGENMYRCGRCAAYVHAHKQLNIQEAPNILTIVLKRFQEGNYGKINKCITFADMLDMIPFMTGTDDIPPLYILYAVVVHLDTLNASFSGHYVAYVKNVQGSWFRINDTEVQEVHISQVMSEEAYILFYRRSCPRPARTYTGKPIQHQATGVPKHLSSKAQISSRSGQIKSSGNFFKSHHSTDHEPQTPMYFTSHPSNGALNSSNRNGLPLKESYATSSDWSTFTSSDDASFTTESTRDSFSTVDYADGGNTDPVSSIFNTSYTREYSSHKIVSRCSHYSSKPQKRYVSVDNGFVSDSIISTKTLDRLQNGENPRHVSVPSIKAPPYVYGGDEDKRKNAPFRTSNHCKF